MGSSMGVGAFLGLRPMAVAMVFNFLEPESLLLCKNKLGKKREGEEDTDLEERDHHVREEEEVGDIEMRQRRSE